MPDVILGTIIGGVIALVAGLLGYVIQGYFSTKNIRLQFEYQQQQTQAERLINVRARYLNPISEHLSSISNSTHLVEKKLRDLVVLSGTEQIAWISFTGLDDMLDSIKSISDSMDSIEKLRPKSNDRQFRSLISKTLTLGDQVSKEISHVSGFQIKHQEEGGTTDECDKEISVQCMKTLTLTTDLFESIGKCYGRIEQILSGME